MTRVPTSRREGTPRIGRDTILDRLLIARRQPREFAWLLHCCGSQLSLRESNGRPLEHATRWLYSQALPFWWDGSDLRQTADID